MIAAGYVHGIGVLRDRKIGERTMVMMVIFLVRLGG
jgi:hypothetical protein